MSEENKCNNNDEMLFIDDMKDYLLLKLPTHDLEVFKKEIESEILIRECTDKRDVKYRKQLEFLKCEYMKQKKQEIDKFTSELEKAKTQIRRKFIKEEEDDDEENIFEEEEEEEEKSKPKLRRGKPKKKL